MHTKIYEGVGAGILTFCAFMKDDVICLGYGSGRVAFVETEKLETLRDNY